YGFNGKENDKETKTQDYGMRIYNPGLGKFLSVDPLTKQYPELTPYQFASNTPIQAIDLDGAEAWVVIKETKYGQTSLKLVFDKDLLHFGGVYFIHRYYEDPESPEFETSSNSGVLPYSEFPDKFP